jgi:hypothetical protein
MLFDVASQKWRELVANVGQIGYMAWSPDSKYVGFDDFLTDDASYRRVWIGDGKSSDSPALRKSADFGVLGAPGRGSTGLFARGA